MILPFAGIDLRAVPAKGGCAARRAGLLVALRGTGRIARPPVVAWLAAVARDSRAGPALSLPTASGMLAPGAALDSRPSPRRNPA